MGTKQRYRTRPPAILLLGIALVALGGLSACQPDADGCPTATLPTTVAYRAIPGVDRDATSLDIHAPAKPCRAPVVVWVHGGGYHVGDKANQIAAKARLFNSKGWILVSVNYRLTVAGDPSSAHYPDHYEDVAAALGWISKNIRNYGGDQSRLALLGHSAGADIVANVADQTRFLHAQGLPMATVDCVAPLDTEGFDKLTSVGDEDSAMWESALGNEPDYLTKTSATRFIAETPKLADTFTVFRGDATRQSIEKAYATKVATTGAAVTLVDARGLTHAEVSSRIGASGDTVITPPLVAFLSRCLR